jgi:ABC-type Fe3+-siderophore transport system permease subunit
MTAEAVARDRTRRRATIGASLGGAGAGLQGAFRNQMYRHVLTGFRALLGLS